MLLRFGALLCGLVLLTTASNANPTAAQQSGSSGSTSGPAHAAGNADSAGLYETIAALDKKLFDAYNNCDLETLGSLVSEDLEFYHDKTGLAVGRKAFIDAIKNNICGKVQRVLVPGTLEAHPLAEYGAVEIGVHTFHHPGDPNNIGIAKFITIWRLKDGAWQVTRAISYDHEPFKK